MAVGSAHLTPGCPFSDVESLEYLLQPAWGAAGRAFTLGMVSGFAKLALTVGNTFRVQNKLQWLHAVYDRPADVGLVTISNHASMFDDPGIICALTPWSFFWTEPWHKSCRWTLCAKEVCFKNELLRQFFTNGKTLPIVRGDGVDQPVMKLAASRVGLGEWVQVFPEGKIYFNGSLGPFRRGAGKLICDARLASGGKDPIVLPYHHSGMGRVLPYKSKWFSFGHDINVVVGEPIDLSDITCDCNCPDKDQTKVWERIVQRMRDKMLELEAKNSPNVDQSAYVEQYEARAAKARQAREGTSSF